jgi:hypothetical protein
LSFRDFWVFRVFELSKFWPIRDFELSRFLSFSRFWISRFWVSRFWVFRDFEFFEILTHSRFWVFDIFEFFEILSFRDFEFRVFVTEPTSFGSYHNFKVSLSFIRKATTWYLYALLPYKIILYTERIPKDFLKKCY